MILQYTKRPLDISSIVSRLQNKGLIVNNQSEAVRFISFVGYFRFRGYAIHFEQPATANFQHGRWIFKSGTNFDDIVKLYELDRALRNLVLNQMERIEIAVRSIITQELNVTFGSHWFLDETESWAKKDQQQSWSENILKDIERSRKSKEPYIVHYYQKYNDPPHPPSWAIAECITFGSWSILYKQLIHGKSKIASQLELTPEILQSWLHSLSVLRNTCAHHGRLWNRDLSFPPKAHKKYKPHFKTPNRFYAFATSIRILTEVIDGNDDFRDGLKDLFNSQSIITPQMLHFPPNWNLDPLWT